MSFLSRRLLVAALALTGLAAVPASLATPAHARAVVECSTTLTNGDDAVIPDAPSPDNNVQSNILVTVQGEVIDVDVIVDVAHPHISQVGIFLNGPDDGTRLITGTGGDGDNLTSTRFDDEAALSITDPSQAPPYTGSFRPQETLDINDGDETYGWWDIQVYDDVTDAQDGTLLGWSLVLTYDCTDTDNDGVDDTDDQCDNLAGSGGSGCPVQQRTVTLRYDNGKFRGKLQAPIEACQYERKVVLYKIVGGDPVKITTATTADLTAAWSFKARRKPGKYVAKAPKIVVADKGECAAATSKTLKLS